MQRASSLPPSSSSTTAYTRAPEMARVCVQMAYNGNVCTPTNSQLRPADASRRLCVVVRKRCRAAKQPLASDQTGAAVSITHVKCSFAKDFDCRINLHKNCLSSSLERILGEICQSRCTAVSDDTGDSPHACRSRLRPDPRAFPRAHPASVPYTRYGFTGKVRRRRSCRDRSRAAHDSPVLLATPLVSLKSVRRPSHSKQIRC